MNLAPCIVASILSVVFPNAFAASQVLSLEGYGRVQFGMTIENVESTLKQRATEAVSRSGCAYAEFKKYPGLRFMVEDGVVTRADARSGIKNSAGVFVGMKLDRVQAMHPHAKLEPHKYDNDGHYVILSTENGRAAIVLEESKGRVTAVRAGLQPAVQYVEGCL